jgi:hypothetical protein
MPIAAPTIGTPVPGGTAGTSVTLDFTTASNGDLLFADIGLADSQAVVPTPPAGWTYIQGSEGASGAASSRTITAYKFKSGDGLVAFTWGTSCKYDAVPSWWTGVGAVEGAVYLAHTVANANFVTTSITPTGSDRWIRMCANSRSTTAARTFLPDAAMVERADFVHGSTNPWPTVQVCDTNGAVTAAPHTYTSVCSGSESHGGTTAVALIPLSTVALTPATLVFTAVPVVGVPGAVTVALVPATFTFTPVAVIAVGSLGPGEDIELCFGPLTTGWTFGPPFTDWQLGPPVTGWIFSPPKQEDC